MFRIFVFFILSSRLIFAFESSEEDPEFQKVHEFCLAESEVDEAILEVCKTDPICPEDPKLKCYLKCIIVKLEIMDDDGEIDVDGFVEMISPDYIEMAEPVIRGCGTVKGTDDCDTAFQTFMCWFAKGPLFMESFTSSYESLI